MTHPNTPSPATQTPFITLGGGCFWCLEAVFEQVRGVLKVESGYCNGRRPNPTYEQVCTGTTGHAEVVRVSFDPGQLTLSEIFEIFFCIHDPTTLNRQGHDAGTQYRSGIYWNDFEQMLLAQKVLAQVQAHYQAHHQPSTVVTELAQEQLYTRAEDHHQHYYQQHPEQAYCAHVIAPKLQKFMQTFARLQR
jgi:peptide-methionine (S)-S-oxide reductase